MIDRLFEPSAKIAGGKLPGATSLELGVAGPCTRGLVKKAGIPIRYSLAEFTKIDATSQYSTVLRSCHEPMRPRLR